MFRKFFVAIPIVVLAIGGSTACATKKFVRTSVGEVNDKVDSQGRAIEETQERTRKNEGRISEVDHEGRRRRRRRRRRPTTRPTAANANADQRRQRRPTASSTRSTRPASASSTKWC